MKMPLRVVSSIVVTALALSAGPAAALGAPLGTPTATDAGRRVIAVANPQPARATVPVVRAGASIPKPPAVARTTRVPACDLHVDAAAASGTGTAASPFPTIAQAVAAAAAGDVVCVAEGEYREQLEPGAKPLTLAGGFRSGTGFTVRDSSVHVSRAIGDGSGSFVRIEDPAPRGRELTAIEGFDISGYSQAIVRQVYYSQRIAITDNHIHDNTCVGDATIGAGFALSNVSGVVSRNVIADNSCGRGGAGAVDDPTDENSLTITANRVTGNSGTEPGISHGGGLYLFSRRLTVRGNLFEANTATGWGGGLYVGAFTAGGQHTTARLSWNRYEDNAAGIAGGGFFCDDGARCIADHEILVANCGGNVLVDSGSDPAGPTVASFDHMTNVGALGVGCRGRGFGVRVDAAGTAADRTTITNSILWGNARRQDLVVGCSGRCPRAQVAVTWTMMQRRTTGRGVALTKGPGLVRPADPLFVDLAARDFHLRSRFGHWTPTGYVPDAVSSPALAAGDPAAPVTNQPERAGERTELGAYGNSREASYVE